MDTAVPQHNSVAVSVTPTSTASSSPETLNSSKSANGELGTYILGQRDGLL